jgi:hypothetical protein
MKDAKVVCGECKRYLGKTNVVVGDLSKIVGLKLHESLLQPNQTLTQEGGCHICQRNH